MQYHKIDIKQIFYENSLKGKILTWDELLIILDDYELSNDFLEDLRNWYLDICELRYIRPDDSFEEIIIHDKHNITYKAFKNKIIKESSLTNKDIETSFLVLALKNNIDWNFNNPFASFKITFNNLPLRVTLIHKSTTPNNQSKAFFRNLSNDIYPLSDFLNLEFHEFVSSIIQNKKNILICGPTGSGKTSLINNFVSKISYDEHLIIIEDTQEIKSSLPQTTNFITSEHDKKSMSHFLAYSMRMSPDRIILGEIRSKEVISFILALNTGHNGAMSTIHSNSAVDAIHRIALLYCIYSGTNLNYQLILKLVCQNIDYVFYMENKKVVDICRIFGSDHDQIMHESILNASTFQYNAS